MIVLVPIAGLAFGITAVTTATALARALAPLTEVDG